jgi:hypothetical protein
MFFESSVISTTGIKRLRIKRDYDNERLISRYSGPFTYELNYFPRAGRNSSWS